MRFCGACGVQAGTGQRFCIACGANLQPAVYSERGTVAEPVFVYPVPPAAWPSAYVAPEVEIAPAVHEEVGPRHASRAPDRRPLVVAALACAGLLVVGGGYLVGDRLLVADDGPTVAQDGSGTPDPAADAGPAPAPGLADVGDQDVAPAPTVPVPPPVTAAPPAPVPPPASVPPPAVGPLLPVSVSATCQAPSGVDAAGAPVSYDAMNTLDGVGGTAWRCAGSAVGQRLVYDFGRPVVLASVALVPGYDKTDPVDGTDRFGENRTVTAVTWGFDTGVVHRQDVPAPGRAMAVARLGGPVSTTRVVLEIAGTGNDGAIRDFTTISDVAFTGSG
ncbi:hypothetical protein SAMN05660662_3834 [Blastococcus aurantiacus]|uniref:F5/8 type C domain-containing protein n=1 Tax=Blastococcus aurantiacus TaxID=1550231 RepID=A0A1G7PZU7_9ACTN|nr:hypothetical protein [Blastococcus aurantiacus]SDF91751.1 hypothetical protein SAMN05660662_3834 [Blastococcus aurantiacus]